MFEILSPGQKLKKLRKELHITQSELASGAISREFISMVEHDVRKLSKDNALLLMKHFKEIAASQNKIIEYTDDYLDLNSQTELLRYIQNEQVKVSTSAELKELLEIAINLEEPEAQGILYKKLARCYFDSDFDQSFLYLNKAKEIYLSLSNFEELWKINNNLGALFQIHNKFEEAVIYLEMALAQENYTLRLDEEITVKTNLCLLYHKLHWYEKCLKILDPNFESLLFANISEKNTNLLVLRAISLSETNQVNDAVRLITLLKKAVAEHGIPDSYIRSNEVYILRKVNIDLAIEEQIKITEKKYDSKISVQNLLLLGDLYFEKGEVKKSLHYHTCAEEKMDDLTYPELKINIYRKLTRDYKTLGKFDRTLLLPFIEYSHKHQFKEDFIKFSLEYLNLSENQSDEDSKIVRLLNRYLND